MVQADTDVATWAALPVGLTRHLAVGHLEVPCALLCTLHLLLARETNTEAFSLNGVEQFPDTSSPVLPMNGVRRINMGETTIRTYRTSQTLRDGDLIAVQAVIPRLTTSLLLR